VLGVYEQRIGRRARNTKLLISKTGLFSRAIEWRERYRCLIGFGTTEVMVIVALLMSVSIIFARAGIFTHSSC
jgi:hypothetical protein